MALESVITELPEEEKKLESNTSVPLKEE